MGLKFTAAEVKEKKDRTLEETFKDGKLGKEIRELYAIVEDLTERVEELENA